RPGARAGGRFAGSIRGAREGALAFGQVLFGGGFGDVVDVAFGERALGVDFAIHRGAEGVEFGYGGDRRAGRGDFAEHVDLSRVDRKGGGEVEPAAGRVECEAGGKRDGRAGEVGGEKRDGR